MNRQVAFVHTDNAQLLPALVAVHALRSRGGGSDGAFDIQLLRLEGSELDARRDGRRVGIGGEAVWDHTHGSSFQYLRRRPPELMNYQGRALIIDPDVYALGSILPLFERDMQGKAVHCRYIEQGFAGDGRAYFGSGVMLLDCAKLRHWRWFEDLDAIFEGRLDLWDTVRLRNEPRESIGELGEIWNSLDVLNSETRLIHFTLLSTQPWATGLVLANERYDPTLPMPEPTWWQRRLDITPQRRCVPHPDPTQERIFFDLLAECLDGGLLAKAYVRSEIAARRMRRDAFDVLTRGGYRGATIKGASLQEEFAIELDVAPRSDR